MIKLYSYFCNVVAFNMRNIYLKIKNNSDLFGMLASSLCIIHCVATPFLFFVQSCAAGGCHSSPSWWQQLDFVFLGISFFAVLQSAKNSTKAAIKLALWFNWFILFVLILIEKNNWLDISENVLYISALGLSVLHLYNLKYCQCQAQTCCTSHE